ncbi:D-glycero-beta-D-manno-heptose 1,7-bisphosphate 7-phosphatase [Pusillimonas sp. ANT_WB101]|uniref:D-glycero-beta-D-manno-heptose 1,7-bisphosphate 7-phosphatase n=1 Tax=Pusillimonas sp. ANT_WB101 TaxID=2597356 RepID=UPI0011F0023B|nr:D-glycero-beta-D-manno-heptose 1,7-bisphosphate 7-phosphatase [Pusillimonas sp. ANT_WB101]KAA0890214.1 D-glycero-beta-D-manno-heptose 1,7-bisphosphate 7-phosphatase [Pusillimonas sp. ANT_WB101]NYT76229.1 D-glycero-beta-D-manno-heptose 1,7-bisphosphate 7-phosphatase [Alcaligenaceae bacterium]
MKLAILDRDGVINHESKDFIKTPDEWVALPGSLDAIARLSQAGWRVVIATNQSGLARGLFSMDSLNAIHAKLRREVAQAGGIIDAIFVCPHGPDDGCECRKPKPGMFLDIARRYEIDFSRVPSVGDSLRDLQAASAAGCKTWLVLTGNGAKTQHQGKLPPGTQVRDNLASVVEAWLTEESA